MKLNVRHFPRFRKNPLQPKICSKAALLLYTFALLLLVPARGLANEAPFYLGGIQVNEPDHAHWISSLKEHKMNTVSVTAYAHQGDWDSENPWFDETNESVLSEIRMAKKNKLKVVLIMRVALDHAFKRNHFLWHGMIMPSSNAQVDEWFSRYTKFVLSWARIAEQEGVDVFAVGSEMNSLTSTIPVEEPPHLETFYLSEESQESYKQNLIKHSKSIPKKHMIPRGGEQFASLGSYLNEQERVRKEWAEKVSFPKDAKSIDRINARRALLENKWRTLVKETRKTYSGKLSYASNFDQFHLVGFWDELDIMGINAYFPLRKTLLPDASERELYTALEQGWKSVFEDIAEFRTEQKVSHMPIIFTELGYTFRRNSTIEPWAMDGFSVVELPSSEDPPEKTALVWREQPIDHRERLLAIRALRRVTSKQYPGALQGILYWKLSTIPTHREIEPFVHIIGDVVDSDFQKELTAFLP